MTCLTLFYNVRLGALGPLPGGATLRVMVLPTPKPQELAFRIGPVTDQGRKVMLDVRQPDANAVDHYFIYLNPEQVPTLAWTRVTLFGKLAGRLLNPARSRRRGCWPCPPPLLPFLNPFIEEPCRLRTRSRLAARPPLPGPAAADSALPAGASGHGRLGAGHPGRPGVPGQPGPLFGCGPGTPGAQGVGTGTLPGGGFRGDPGFVAVVEPLVARALPD